VVIETLFEIGREIYMTLTGHRQTFEQVAIKHHLPFSAKASKGILLRAAEKLKSCEAPWREAGWSGRRESNPRMQLGKLPFCH
jgi:hypothetical protein